MQIATVFAEMKFHIFTFHNSTISLVRQNLWLLDPNKFVIAKYCFGIHMTFYVFFRNNFNTDYDDGLRSMHCYMQSIKDSTCRNSK